MSQRGIRFEFQRVTARIGDEILDSDVRLSTDFRNDLYPFMWFFRKVRAKDKD
jgi:hypothetical protein